MSLINDALKRAHQRQQESAPRAPVPPMQPVLTPVHRARFPLAGVAMALVFIGVGGWALYRWNRARHVPLGASSPVHAERVTRRMESWSPAPAAVVADRIAVVVSNAPPPVVVSPLEVEALPVAAPPSVTPFPPLRLKGIIFGKTNRSALINGRSVFEGDSIDGVKVMKIERDGVTVEFGAEQRRITL